MKSIMTLIAFISILGGCATTQKPLNKMNDLELTHELLNSAGVLQGLRAVKQKLEAAENQAVLSGKSTETTTIVFKSMKEAFTYEKLSRPIIQIVNQELTRREKEEVIRWYRSDLGKIILQREHLINTPQGQQHFQAWINGINQGTVKISQEQIKYAREILEYSGALEMTIETVASMSVGMMVGMNSILPTDKRLKRSDLDKQIQFVKLKLTETLEPTLVLTMVFTYGYLTPDQQKNFKIFLKDGSGHKFSKVVVYSFIKSFKVAAKNIGKNMGRHLSSLTKK